MLSSNQVEQVVAAIYRVEGAKHTRFPYGIKQNYQHTTPHNACFNTVSHVSRTYHAVSVDRSFIYYLADVYCPPSDDPKGNKNWKVNMVAILRLNN